MAHEFFASLFQDVARPFIEQVSMIVGALPCTMPVDVEFSTEWDYSTLSYHFVATITSKET